MWALKVASCCWRTREEDAALALEAPEGEDAQRTFYELVEASNKNRAVAARRPHRTKKKDQSMTLVPL